MVSFHNFQRSFDFLLILDWNHIAEKDLRPMRVNDLQPDSGNSLHLETTAGSNRCLFLCLYDNQMYDTQM
jgi:hypothetical protein